MPQIIAKGIFAALLIFGTQASAEDVQINVTQDDCSRIEKHIARDDVAYKPGVDVHGKAVAPADLNESRLQFPDKLTIDLSLPFKDLFKNYNRRLENAELQVGEIEYSISSGKMKFNGQELSDPALHEIAVKCREIYLDKDS